MRISDWSSDVCSSDLTHKWLALGVGVQALLWTLTGFYMVVVHIDTIHGDHLVRSPVAQPFDLDGLAAPSKVVAAAPGVSEIRLQRFFGQPVWRAETPEGARLFDARSGAPLPALTERTEERRVGNGGCSTWRSRGS